MVANKTIQQASYHWLLAAFSYVGFNMLWMAAFLSETGETTNSQREGRWGGFLGAAAFSIAITILTLALLSRAHEIGGASIPSLILAARIHPTFAFFYSMIMFIGIYSSAVPLLWNPCARFAEEGTGRFRLLVLVLGSLGGILGMFLDFKALINVLYVFNGYVGMLLLAIMIVHFIRYRGFVKTKSQAETRRK